MPTFGAASRGITALGDVVAGHATEKDVTDIKEGAKEAKEQTKGLLREAPSQEPSLTREASKKTKG